MRARNVQIEILAVLIAMAVLQPLPSSAQNSGQAALSLDEIVSRMEAARLQFRHANPFLLLREYRMYHGKDAAPMSQVKAEINVVPPRAREYRITESRGNGRGEKVVRKILDHEVDAEKSTPPPTAVIRLNYDFELLGNDTCQGSHCYVVQLKPKREELGLIKGKAWVDDKTFLVRKIEGQLAKSPSWWVKRVNVSVVFGQLGGIWMQTASNATADVRLVGQYTVNGQVTGVQPSAAVASAPPPEKKVQRRDRRPAAAATTLASGVLINR